MTHKQRFPGVPDWFASMHTEMQPAFLRVLGASVDDLSMNFLDGSRPAVITRILAQCSETHAQTKPEERVLWELPIGVRIYAMLELAALSDPRPFTWRVRCCFSDCNSQSELEIELAEIAALVPMNDAPEIISTHVQGHDLRFRLPTGTDQLQWLSKMNSEENPLQSLARSILVSPDLDTLLQEQVSFDAIGQIIDDVMEQFDPLVNFHLGVVCPECGRSSDQSPDLAAAALERLWRAQNTLLDDVHLLASRYHWSEGEIFQLPHWRRQAYLHRIESQEA